MDYQEFRAILINELKEVYGKDTLIITNKILKNNGKYYEGLHISSKVAEGAIPIINLDEIYEEYRKGNKNIKDCIMEICECREGCEFKKEVLQFSGRLLNYDSVKENIYPILLSTKANQELLQELVTMPILDLSIAYIVRGEKGTCAKIKKEMLQIYGVDSHELHEQAIKNMKKDRYRFQDMEEVVRDLLSDIGEEDSILLPKGLLTGKMYVLTNALKLYGAAGILDKQFIRNFAENRCFFILPSSIHETIFIADDKKRDGRDYNEMIAEVNENTVGEEERLSNHCYYYDAEVDEVRIWG